MKKKNTVNKILYAISVILLFILTILLSLLVFDKSLYPFSIPLVCIVFLFSPLGNRLRYIRVLTVSFFTIITSVLVGFIIPLNIKECCYKQGVLPPAWLYPLSIFCAIFSIVIGLILSYMIFKKYYKKEKLDYENELHD